MEMRQRWYAASEASNRRLRDDGLSKRLQRVGAVIARRRDGSGGKLPAGRVLELGPAEGGAPVPRAGTRNRRSQANQSHGQERRFTGVTFLSAIIVTLFGAKALTRL